jgi:hypothetical protein
MFSARHIVVTVLSGVITLSGTCVVALAEAPSPARLKALLQSYVADPKPEVFGEIQTLSRQGTVTTSLEYCLTRDNRAIAADLPALQRTLELYGSRGHINSAAGGNIMSVTFWGDGEETLAKAHDVPSFQEYMSLSTFVDIRIQNMDGLEWTYCSVTDHSIDSPRSTEAAKALVGRLSDYKTRATRILEDFAGSKHESYGGQWGASTWVIEDGAEKSFFSVTAREIGIAFEFHRVREATQ